MITEEKKIQRMVTLYNSLSEKDRRRYAAIESQNYGHGGITYISSLFGCDEKTIRKGLLELDDSDAMNRERIRIMGGGRISKLKEVNNINDVFIDIIKEHTAGNPMKENVKWTDLTKAEIIKKMAKKGIKISRNIVRKLLKKNGFVKRKIAKSKSMGKSKDRNSQFEKISEIKKEYESSDNPIISVDTKKQEKIGNLYREGKLECTETITVYDHDFPELATGKIIPYTIYDVKRNEAFVFLGTSFDTSEFACDAIKSWWNTLGKKRYPNATSILALADSGGSNSCNSNIFKEDLQNVANTIKMDIQVSHYPTYASKWNPIEHRVFPHITRSLSGVVLENVELAKELIKKTTTTTGLKVFVKLSRKVYEKGRKISDDFFYNLKIIFDDVLGKWNYAIFCDA